MLLNDYGTGNVPIPKGDESQWVLTYEDAMLFIRSMPFYTQSDLFGRERNGSSQGIVAGLYQTFEGEELYRSPQEKAANLLYQVVKDHPFSDSNKRCAAALFVYFLNGNGILGDDDSLLVESNALAAMDDCTVRTCREGHDDRTSRELPHTARITGDQLRDRQ